MKGAPWHDAKSERRDAEKETGAGVCGAMGCPGAGGTVVRAIIEGREENHLTQEQLADATGIHQTNISKLESGTANPSLRTLKRLAAGMGMRLKLEFGPAQSGSGAR